MNAADEQPGESFKLKDLSGGTGGSGFAAYRRLMYGDAALGRVILCELLTTLFGWVPGALGLFLRSKSYPLMFGRVGPKVVFGQNVTIRHPHKIFIGSGVIVDDNAVLDAKGDTNEGITLGNNVYIGRNSIVYCKNGNITIGNLVNISSNCQVFSSNKLTIGEGTVVGAFSYFLSGGEYDIEDPTPFAMQPGTGSTGELSIGKNCWFGARVTVVDGAGIGDHCVVGAGAVVVDALPADSLAVGIPARVIKSI
jgi:acetyltransferase-like isoleucine patch superfamily enzyme